ncbi:tRNA dihydrouridine(20/20a) synthase DusA [Candidatus Pantoea carbekii]|nr:tRNA dihydrouridine(20/20a) synthase DusA [Candidatus Pantoea carbekii]
MKNTFYSQRFSIAPMLKRTDRHCRYFFRKLSKNTLLYTEMISPNAIMHAKNDYLAYNDEEHPVALQLGSSNTALLAYCAKLAELRGYDQINLNVGCPSQRVQKGHFGASLMGEPMLVADCVKAMRDVVSIPVTVKTRIGIDDSDSYKFLYDFVSIVAEKGGCDNFIVHARKAWLSGFSTKENREIPPLDYSRVYKLKRDFLKLTISINGGIRNLDEAKVHLQYLDGVMIGRAAYQNPYILAEVDRVLFNCSNTVQLDLITIVRSMYPYIEAELTKGTCLGHITRHMTGLFQKIPGSRKWKHYLNENAYKPDADIEVLEKALSLISI